MLQLSGAKINGNAANATLNVIIPNFFIVLVYINSTYGWQANYIGAWADLNGQQNAGSRISIPVNSSFNINSNTTASSIYIDGSVTVPANDACNVASVRPGSGAQTVVLGNGSTITGFEYQVNVTGSSNVNDVGAAYGCSGKTTVVGKHKGTGLYGNATGGSGHTGELVAVSMRLNAASGSTFCVVAHEAFTGPLTYGLYIAPDTDDAGNSMQTGIYIHKNARIQQWAFEYYQNTANAGFLRMVDSAGNERFKIDGSGDITLVGNGRMFMGDAVLFKSASANTSSGVYISPNGSPASPYAELVIFAESNQSNTNLFKINISTSAVLLQSTSTGSATPKNLALRVGSSSNNSVSIDSSRNLYLGDDGGLSTTSTAGFPYMPSVAGVATGTPTTSTNFVPFLYNKTNNKLGVYNSGWKWVTLA